MTSENKLSCGRIADFYFVSVKEVKDKFEIFIVDRVNTVPTVA